MLLYAAALGIVFAVQVVPLVEYAPTAYQSQELGIVEAVQEVPLVEYAPADVFEATATKYPFP